MVIYIIKKEGEGDVKAKKEGKTSMDVECSGNNCLRVEFPFI